MGEVFPVADAAITVNDMMADGFISPGEVIFAIPQLLPGVSHGVMKALGGVAEKSTYKISSQLKKHTTGNAGAGKSQFLNSVDAEKTTLDAADYADANKLWHQNKAKVPTTTPAGVYSPTGELTNTVNLYRTNDFNGVRHVHGAPGKPKN